MMASPIWRNRTLKENPGMQFHSDDMTCGGCVGAIRGAVASVDPAAQVSADLAAHRIDVTSALPRDRIAAAIQGAGFRLRPETTGA